MRTRMGHQWLIVFVVACLAGCGGSQTLDEGAAILAVKVQGARSFNPSVAPGQIEVFEVRVSAPDIPEPIVAEFSGDAAEGVIEGVPTGSDRVVEVIARNANAQTIRAGEAPGVRIGGGMNEVDVALESVPIFTNLTAGAVVENTRLIFRLFADPEHPLLIERIADDGADALVDPATSVAEIQLDFNTGLGRMAPAVIEAGMYRFRVRDLVTDRASEVEVRLIDAGTRRPAPLFSAAQAGMAGTMAVSSFDDLPVVH